MGAVVWFGVGAVASALGALALGQLGWWGAWAGSLLGGAVAVALTRRIAVVAGGSGVSAVVGSLVAPGVLGSALLAVVSVLVNAAGFLLRAGVESATSSDSASSVGDRMNDVPTVPPRKARAARSASETGAAAGPAFTSREVEAMLRLAEEDTTLFRRRLGGLTAQQREQVRAALRSRKGASATHAS
jgi:hypothetical protein